MALIYDMQAYRVDGERRVMESQDPLPVGVETIDPIQSGCDWTSMYLGAPRLKIMGLHSGYGLSDADYPEARHTYDAGDRGIGDFMRGFDEVYERVNPTQDKSGAFPALFSYGMFMSSRLLLPEVIDTSEIRKSTLTSLAEKEQVRYPELSLEGATKIVINRAAARIMLTFIVGNAQETFGWFLNDMAKGGSLVKRNSLVRLALQRPLPSGNVRHLAGKGSLPRPEVDI